MKNYLIIPLQYQHINYKNKIPLINTQHNKQNL